jgi:prepilin-type N-terminal cleavage/methylation domain-containing protein
MGSSRKTSRAAFTLVEMMIVVMVLAIAAVAAITMLGDTESIRLGAAARLLIADLAFAQTESIAHPDDPYGLKFDASTESYSVVRDTTYPPFDCASGDVVAVADPVTGQGYSMQFGSGRGAEFGGVVIDAVSLEGDDCIVFGAYGQTDQSTTATITLSAGGETLTIQIDPISGEATLP